MEKFIELFANAIEVDINDVKLGQELESYKTWDSLGVVTFIAMVNQEYNKQITADDIRNAKTVQDLYNLLGS